MTELEIQFDTMDKIQELASEYVTVMAKLGAVSGAISKMSRPELPVRFDSQSEISQFQKVVDDYEKNRDELYQAEQQLAQQRLITGRQLKQVMPFPNSWYKVEGGYIRKGNDSLDVTDIQYVSRSDMLNRLGKEKV